MNFSTIIISAIIFLAFVGVIVREVKNKKSGKGSCACGCSNCAMSGTCHSK